MNNYKATEIAYKNGYLKGVSDFRKRLEEKSTENCVGEFGFVVTLPEIEQIAKELQE